jgi:hypothetical protein
VLVAVVAEEGVVGAAAYEDIEPGCRRRRLPCDFAIEIALRPPEINSIPPCQIEGVPDGPLM